MKRLLSVALLLALTACGSGTPASNEALHAPHAGVQVQLRAVDAIGQGTLDWQGRPLSLREPALATSADIIDVSTNLDPANQPALAFRFRPEAAERLHKATEALVGKQVAVTVDDHVLTVATVQGPFGSSMQVNSAGASAQQIQDLARYITQGGPPVQLQ